eukprot:TRINITY_DN22680_c0_g1_i1.p1 TRINITY_DN22680_c0_g1~~TRINITY_DN22680_c0_g1_i1.p1  ORF type:complete len:641 (-),score=123.37 TRINITY_DN22680_c0_g1_i1:187-1920(-)
MRLLNRDIKAPELIQTDFSPDADVFHGSSREKNNLNVRLLPGGELSEDEDDGDVTPKVHQLDSVRELDEEPKEPINRGLERSGCWSSFSWSSLYDRGTDSSLSWADDEYEKETTETVQALFNQIEELFYESKNSRKKKASGSSVQEKECQIWREHFPHFRVVGHAVTLSKQKNPRNKEDTNLSITGSRSNVARRNALLQRKKITRKNKSLNNNDPNANISDNTGHGDVEETFAEHGDYKDSDKDQRFVVSQKFETEPSKYFEEKLFSALFDKILTEIAEEIQPAIESYTEKVISNEKPHWEDEIYGVNQMSMRTRKPFNSIDSLEDDSIFSLGKIVMSPRYGQYPDLSDDEENQSLNPLSLPHIRPVPSSAPPARILQRPSTSQTQLQMRPKRSNSFKTENNLLSKENQEKRKTEIKKQNRSLERNSKPNSSSSIRSQKFRRSRSQSGSPPYGRQPVSLPPIERPKTMGSQNSLRRSRTPGRADLEQKTKNGRNPEVHFSVSGKGLKQPDDRKNGMSSRISMNGPVHWDFGGLKIASLSKRKLKDPLVAKPELSSTTNSLNRSKSAPKPRKLRPLKL